MSDIESHEELEALESEILDEHQEAGHQEQKSHSTEFMGAEVCEGLCASIFNLIASRNGDHWRLNQEESQALATAADAVLAKYIPAGFEKYSAETALIIVAAGIVLPRMNKKAADDGKA